jgi:hypothetical protein
LLALILLLGASAVPSLAEPAEDDELSEVLSGFEDEGEELDDVLGGFEDDDEFVEADSGEPDVPEAKEPSFWDLTGSLSLGVTYNLHEHSSGSGTPYGNLSRLRPKLNLQLDLDLPREWKARASGYGFYDFAYLAHGRGAYTDEVLDEYEWEVELQDLYVQGSLLDDLDLKVGRQVVNWGRSDTLRVVDVINPLDNREPGLVDLEDLRRAVGAVRLDYYLGNWSFTALAVPELRFDKNPVFGSDFYPDIDVDPEELSSLIRIDSPFLNFLIDFIECLSGTDDFSEFLSGVELPIQVIPDNRPDHFGERPEWGVAATGIFSGWDISFYAARFYENTGRVALVPSSSSIPIAIEILPFLPPISTTIEADLFIPEIRYSWITMLGVGANVLFGSWLVKAELAYLDGLEFDFLKEGDLVLSADFFPWPPSLALSANVRSKKKSRLDVMGGIEYYGFQNTSIALEVVNRHIRNFEAGMRGFPNFAQRNALESALRVTRTFLRERLEVTLLGVAFGIKAQDGSTVRLSAEYELREALELSGGVLLFQSGDLVAFSQVGRNDRVFLGIRYSF